MTEAAIILCHPETAASARKISRLLEFFGVTSRAATVTGLLNEPAGHTQNQLRILGSTGDFLKLSAALESQPESRHWWQTRVASAFCYLGENDSHLAGFARKLNGTPGVQLQSAGENSQPWKVSQTLKNFCGPFAGLTIPSAPGPKTPIWLFETAAPKTEIIIARETGAAFLRIDFFGVPLFVSTSDVINIDAPLTSRDFNVHRHFLAAVPAVLYVKSELAAFCWQPPETAACLVIDDPLLRPRYGFLDYQRLLALMDRLDFSTNIAFIPWNRKRSSPQTVRLFQENPNRFSLSIHGCDHTSAEYGARDLERLAWKSRESVRRMADHSRRTGLPHDQVMVFPQGVFSEMAMAALKAGDFIGAVNSEVISTDPQPPKITIGDYWNVGVMNYCDFPIFTRRYPWAGIGNFAFDILLGKPCLVNVHHNDFHDNYQCLTECIEQLNRLNATLHWTSLAEVVRRSFRRRESAPGVTEVEMYGNEVRLENPSAEKKLFRVYKRESAPGTIREIRAGQKPIAWIPEETSSGKGIRFETVLAPGESQTVVLQFQPVSLTGVRAEGLAYQAKVRLRRHLCEVRDNYVMRKSFSE